MDKIKIAINKKENQDYLDSLSYLLFVAYHSNAFFKASEFTIVGRKTKFHICRDSFSWVSLLNK